MTATRQRIHLTQTPQLAAILARHQVPGEPKTATLVRLVEKADALLDVPEEDFLIFHPDRPPLTVEEIKRIEEEDFLNHYLESIHG